MNNKLQLKTQIIETQIGGVKLKGTLKYSTKDYIINLDEPFKSDKITSHLQYTIPVKYVVKKSENPNCYEIDIIEKTIETFQSIYLEHKDKKGK